MKPVGRYRRSGTRRLCGWGDASRIRGTAVSRGYQDTLVAAPLSEKEDTARRLRQFLRNLLPRKHGRHLYKELLYQKVETYTFILKQSTAYFESSGYSCETAIAEVNGYVTAASTYEGQKWLCIQSLPFLTSDCP